MMNGLITNKAPIVLLVFALFIGFCVKQVLFTNKTFIHSRDILRIVKRLDSSKDLQLIARRGSVNCKITFPYELISIEGKEFIKISSKTVKINQHDVMYSADLYLIHKLKMIKPCYVKPKVVYE